MWRLFAYHTMPVMKAQCALLFVLMTSLAETKAEPTFSVLKNLDVEKFWATKWWLTHRAQRLRENRLDRCLAISVSRRFNDQKLYLQIDHENSGAIDQAYFPATIESQGIKFTMEDGEKATLDIVFTDYDSFTVGYLSLEKRRNEFLVLYATVPEPESDLLEKMKSKLVEVTGVGIDALQTVDNANCPEKNEEINS